MHHVDEKSWEMYALCLGVLSKSKRLMSMSENVRKFRNIIKRLKATNDYEVKINVLKIYRMIHTVIYIYSLNSFIAPKAKSVCPSPISDNYDNGFAI